MSFTFRTNATSSHKHYINGIGEHDTYVEFATLHVNVPLSHLIHAVMLRKPALTKLTKSVAYQLVSDYATTYGIEGGETPDDASISDASKLIESHLPPFVTAESKCHLGQLRVWATRPWAVNALGFVISGLKADTAPPKTVGALWQALNTIAMQHGMRGVPEASEETKRLADAIIFDALPLYGKRQYAPVVADTTVAEPSTELIEATAETTLAEAADATPEVPAVIRKKGGKKGR